MATFVTITKEGEFHLEDENRISHIGSMIKTKDGFHAFRPVVGMPLAPNELHSIEMILREYDNEEIRNRSKKMVEALRAKKEEG